MRIRQLTTHVANQIAAGEVIERPASVIKELLENALDAGATHIHIEIGFGGLNTIQVSDNGIGILAEDLPLAIASHATSKLETLDDLYAINSMGFRGEALASIASIAHLSIESKTEGAAHAMRLSSDDAGMRVAPCARNQGTTVLVRDLFYNAPVRKKFLKSDIQEYQAIEAVIRRIALAYPSVSLHVKHGDKTRLNLPGSPSIQTAHARLAKLFGKSFIDDAIQVDVSRGDVQLCGWVSGPSYARSQQDKMWFYVNQRMVRDKLLLHALRQAYADVLPEGRYPACALFLNMPLTDVDINVHPTKHEVRFSDARTIHDLIHLAMAEALSESSIQPTTTSSRAHQLSKPIEAFSHDVSQSMVGDWIALNDKFAVLTHEKSHYLVDVVSLCKHMNTQALLHTELPWPSRPLLVPISIPLPESISKQQLNLFRGALSDLGLVFDEVTQDDISVRAIPKSLPDISLHAFFQAFTDKKDFKTQLVSANKQNTLSLTPDEKASLLCYWRESFNLLQPISMLLDTKKCEEILSDA